MASAFARVPGLKGIQKGLGERETNDWLKQRQENAAQGISTPRADKLMVSDLVGQLFEHYRKNGHKSRDEIAGICT